MVLYYTTFKLPRNLKNQTHYKQVLHRCEWFTKAHTFLVFYLQNWIVIWDCLPPHSPTGKALWERLTAPEDGFSKLQRENISIIESYGKALMEVVCRDACDGHEISRVRGTDQLTDLIIFKFSEKSVIHVKYLMIHISLTSVIGCFLCFYSFLFLSDVGSGSFGPHSVHRPSKSVASLHLQQWLPAITSGEPETGWCCPAEPANASASPSETTLHLCEQDGETHCKSCFVLLDWMFEHVCVFSGSADSCSKNWSGSCGAATLWSGGTADWLSGVWHASWQWRTQVWRST